MAIQPLNIPTGPDLIAATARNSYVDFSPLAKAFEYRDLMAQRQRENEFKQRQMDFEAERIGFDKAAATRAQELFPLQKQQMQGGISAQAQALRTAQQEYGFRADLHPLEIAAKRKAIEAAKFGTIKDGDQLYTIDPSAPGGARFIEPPGGSIPKMDPATRKEIIETDDMIRENIGVLDAMKKAKQLNEPNRAYDGVGAAGRALIVNNSYGPWTPFVDEKRAVDTTELSNLTTQQALSSLKAIFGAAPTEGERKILLELQGSVNQTRAERARIYDTAVRLAENRLRQQREKATALRSGRYYRPDGQPEGLQRNTVSPDAPGAQSREALMKEAEDAIAKGAPRDKVMERLQQRLNQPAGGGY